MKLIMYVDHWSTDGQMYKFYDAETGEVADIELVRIHTVMPEIKEYVMPGPEDGEYVPFLNDNVIGCCSCCRPDCQFCGPYFLSNDITYLIVPDNINQHEFIDSICEVLKGDNG